MPWPTNLYPKVLYSTSRSIEAQYPVVAADPMWQEVGPPDAFAQSGKRQALTYRREESRTVGFLGVTATELEQWRQFFQDQGGRGKQFEFLLDRYTGGQFTCENTLTDQDLATTLSYSLTSSFTPINSKTALVFPGSGACVLNNVVGSLNQHLVNSGGTIVLAFAPDFGSNTGSQEVFLDSGASGAISNRLRFYKSGSAQVDFEVAWATGSKQSVRWAVASWATGNPVTVIMQYPQYSSTTSVRMWFGTLQASNMPETQAGSLTTMPGTLHLHHNNAAAEFASGKLLFLGFYRYPYDDPTVLASSFPVGRNYYGKGEILERDWRPRRVGESVDHWQWAWTVRQGF